MSVTPPRGAAFWKTGYFWRRFAAAFAMVWIGFVIVVTKGDQGHWLSNTLFLLPIAVWVIVAIVFRKDRHNP